jgi:hypothetical protein
VLTYLTPAAMIENHVALTPWYHRSLLRSEPSVIYQFVTKYPEFDTCWSARF